MKTRKLKNCPFCLGSATILQSKAPFSFLNGWQVGCSTGYYHESCCGHIVYSVIYKSKSQAIRAWNRRMDRMLEISKARKKED